MSEGSSKYRLPMVVSTLLGLFGALGIAGGVAAFVVFATSSDITAQAVAGISATIVVSFLLLGASGLLTIAVDIEENTRKAREALDYIAMRRSA